MYILTSLSSNANYLTNIQFVVLVLHKSLFTWVRDMSMFLKNFLPSMQCGGCVKIIANDQQGHQIMLSQVSFMDEERL
jgi:hypothetical protein